MAFSYKGLLKRGYSLITFATQSVKAFASDGMTVTETWLVRGDTYQELRNADAATVRVDATISNTDDGILMESGAEGQGLILYVFNGVLYFQCGNGGDFGSGDIRAEIAYTLPVGEFNYIIEWSASIVTQNAVLYINGTSVGTDTFDETNLGGSNSGTVGEVESSVCKNRADWTNDQQGSFTNTISKCDVFLGQITSDV